MTEDEMISLAEYEQEIREELIDQGFDPEELDSSDGELILEEMGY